MLLLHAVKFILHLHVYARFYLLETGPSGKRNALM